MGKEIIQVNPTSRATIVYPDNITSDIFIIAKAFAEITTQAIIGTTTTNAVEIIISQIEATTYRVAFEEEKGRILRDYIIPTVALFGAYQTARNIINSSSWDEDFKKAALEQVVKSLDRYRQNLLDGDPTTDPKPPKPPKSK